MYSRVARVCVFVVQCLIVSADGTMGRYRGSRLACVMPRQLSTDVLADAKDTCIAYFPSSQPRCITERGYQKLSTLSTHVIVPVS